MQIKDESVLFLQRVRGNRLHIAGCWSSYVFMRLHRTQSRQTLLAVMCFEENMRHLNSRLLLAAAASLGLTTIASAADLPARTWTKAPMMDTPACAWCGWYVGGNGGFAFGNTTGNLTSSDVGFGSTVALGLIPTALGAKHDGGYGGGQFGYNFVMSNVLIGFEADIQGANIGSDQYDFLDVFNPDNETTSATLTGRDRIDWFGTARGRLGFSFGSVAALRHRRSGVRRRRQLRFRTTSRSTGSAARPTRPVRATARRSAGPRARVFEWMFAPTLELQDRISSRRSRQHGPRIRRRPGAPISGTYHFSHAFDSARLGINYHFGAPIAAKY